jgi:hypothetical protein
MAQHNSGLSLSGAVGSGDRRQALEAMRDALAAAMELAEPSVMAQLAGQLRQVLRELDELPASEGKSKRDELADRRKNRRAKAAVSAPATGSH